MLNLSAPTLDSLLTHSPDIRGDRWRLTGSGLTVRRLVAWHKLGLTPHQILAQLGHLTSAQIHVALAHYYLDMAPIDADLEQEAAVLASALRVVDGFSAPGSFLPPRLYFEEDSTWQSLQRQLRALQVDVTNALIVNMLERPDQEHLAYTALQRRVLVTFNGRDYQALHHLLQAQELSHAGVIVLKPDSRPPAQLAARLLARLTTQPPLEWANTFTALPWD